MVTLSWSLTTKFVAINAINLQNRNSFLCSTCLYLNAPHVVCSHSSVKLFEDETPLAGLQLNLKDSLTGATMFFERYQ